MDSLIQSYGGVATPSFLIIEKVSFSTLPQSQVNQISVPMRAGAYFANKNYGVRTFTVDFTIKAPNKESVMYYAETLADWLDYPEPTELIFRDKPDVVYYAIVDGSADVAKFGETGRGSINFLCLDPFGYSTTTKSITPTNNKFTFVNNGTTTTFPKFTVDFAQDSSFVSFTSPDGVILIGNPSSPEEIKLPPTQYMINDPMTGTSNWSTVTSGLDAGRVAMGTIAEDTDGEAIIASDYGTGTSGAKIWHGPAIRRDLSTTVKDFTVKARMDFKSQDGTSALDGNQMGRLEIYGFNSSGGKIFKLVMRDSYTHYEFNIPEIFAGNATFLEKQPSAPSGTKVSQKLYTTYTVKKGDTWTSIAKAHHMTASDLAKINGKTTSSTLSVGQKLKVYDKTVTNTVYPTHVGDYNDFYGEFTIQRVGTTWYAEVSRMESGTLKKSKTIKKTFHDVEGEYPVTDLSYVVVNFLQYDTQPVVQEMRLTDLKVIKHNTDTTIDVPAIFQSGDELEVDLSDSSVYLNGDPYMEYVDVASTFFPIYEGTTEVQVNTDDDWAIFSAEYVERYL